jgi:hypothetical protein
MIRFIRWVGARLGTSATSGPIVPAPDGGGDDEYGAVERVSIGRGNRSIQQKTYPSATAIVS